MRLLAAICLTGMLFVSGCSATLGHYGNSKTAISERTTLIIGHGVIVDKVDDQLVWDTVGSNGERIMTVDPGLRILKVNYGLGRTTAKHNFSAGVTYRLAVVPIKEGNSVSFVIAPEKEKEKEKRTEADVLPAQ